MNKEFEKYYGKYDIHDLVDEFNSVLPTMRQLIKYSEFKTILVEVAKQKELIDKIKATTPLELAIMFHNTYEELAPKFNYETRKDTKEFDENSNNGKLMIAVCSKLLDLIKEYEDDSKTNV